MKVILQTSDLQIEIDGKEYVISFKDGVKVVEESEIGRWVMLK